MCGSNKEMKLKVTIHGCPQHRENTERERETEWERKKVKGPWFNPKTDSSRGALRIIILFLLGGSFCVTEA